MYRLFGWWFRWQACKMAALTMSKRCEDEGEGFCPKLWSLAVFYESYMLGGAENTEEDFGPTEPVKLEAVKNG